MNTSERLGSLVARVALAAIFIHAGWGKLTGLEGTAAFIGSKGLPAPLALAALAGLTELAGGLLLVLGWRTRPAALALALFLVPATILFHNPAGLAGAEAQMQQIQVYKNVAIIGGLVAIATWGAGALSLDARAALARIGRRGMVAARA